MNYMELEDLDNIIFRNKTYFKHLGYIHSNKFINEIFNTTSNKYNIFFFKESIKNGINIKHYITRRNKKIIAYWLHRKQCSRILQCFDEFMIHHSILTDFDEKNVDKKYIKEFWENHSIEEIENIDEQWFFDRMFFYSRVIDYWHVSDPYYAKNMSKKDVDIILSRDFSKAKYLRVTPGQWRTEYWLEPFFDKKNFGNLYDRSIFGWFL